jgi:hypothetical protein
MGTIGVGWGKISENGKLDNGKWKVKNGKWKSSLKFNFSTFQLSPIISIRSSS